MTQYLGDFVEDDTVYVMFNTYTSDDPSASCTITNFINTDVHIHKDGGLTQRNNAAGITVSVDYDGITGSHLIAIDTSNNTVAGFWTTGSDYFVRIEGTSIDAGVVNAVVGHFSIENRFMRGTNSASLATSLATAQTDLDTITGADGVTLATAQALYAPNTVVPDAAGVAPTAVEIRTEIDSNSVDLNNILADTNELQTNQGAWATATGFSTHSSADVWAVGTRSLTDKVGFSLSTAGLDAIWDDLTSGMTAVGSVGKLIADNLDAAVSTRNSTTPPTVVAIRTEMDSNSVDLNSILADTNELQTNQGNWITATGFSAHSAADVWAVASRILTASTNFNDLSAADVNAQVDTALSDIHLDHLLAVDYDPAVKPGVATALFNELIENDAGVSRYTANALEQAPTGGSAPTVDQIADGVWDELKSGHTVANSFGDYLDDEITSRNATVPPTVTAIRQEMDTNSTKMAPSQTLNDYKATGFSTHDAAAVWSVASRILTASTNFNDISTAQVNTEVDTALADIHLDHLLAANYDPASKPGVATALLNELVENDGGVSRYTANALEQAPSGGTNPNVLVDTTIATVTDQTHIILTAGSNDNDAYKDQALVVYDASDSDFPSVRVCTAYTGATRTVTIDTAPDFTMVGGDGAKLFVTAPGTSAPTSAQNADAVWDELKSGHAVPDSFGDYLDGEITSRNATTPPTAVAIRTEIDSNSTRLSAIEADTTGIAGSAMRGTDSAALATALATHDGKLDTVDGVVDAILIDTAGLNGSAMRGTDGANTTTPPTVTAIRQEMDTNSVDLNAIVIDVAGLNGAAMRGTDGANTTTPDAAGVAATLHTTTDALVSTVDTVVDTILVDTNELQTNQGNWATATSVTVSDKTGFALSTAGVDAILDENVEGTHTMREMLRLIASTLVGKVSGGGTTQIVFRDIDDTKNRIVATVTAEGNRTVMSLTED